MTLRDLGLAVTGKEELPQKMKYHREKLIEAGLLRVVHNGETIEPVESRGATPGFVQIPILGAASCGPALEIAQESVEGYLVMSEKLVPANHDAVFALRAVGPSMNLANVNNKTIEDGDIVLVDGNVRQPSNNMYVLSVIGDAANIKKYVEEGNGQIALVSESTEDFLPIYIHPEDDSSFFINGKVIDVFKKRTKQKQYAHRPF